MIKRYTNLRTLLYTKLKTETKDHCKQDNFHDQDVLCPTLEAIVTCNGVCMWCSL